MKLLFTILFFSFSLVASSQTSSEKLIKEGVSLHDKKRYQDAVNCYKEALKVNPSSMSAVYEMSLSYLQMKDYANAILFSSKVIDANFQPLLVDAYTVKATALAAQNKVEDAIKLLNQAVDRCGDEYLLHFNLGLSYFNKKDNKMAIFHLRKSVEIDPTRPSSFLLYAYALNDGGKWIQSFYAFHFFLLLEPNTERSKEAFDEMLDIINNDLPANDSRLVLEDGINRLQLYNAIKAKRSQTADAKAEYKYFMEASKIIFFSLSQMQNDTQRGLLWEFFVPTYEEILGSGYFDAYCRYVSVAHFPESLSWWNSNKEQVDNFIEWFEQGDGNSGESDGDDGEE